MRRRSVRVGLLGGALLSGGLLLGATPAPAAGPRPAAAPPARLDARRVDTIFQEYAKQGSPGCAVGVAIGTQLLFARGYGMASLEHDTPNTRATVFDIGSTSKQFTAAAIVLLAHEGRLALDDDIREVLPEIPDYGSRITIRHLLTHTSGLRDYTDLLSLAGKRDEDVTTSADAIAILTRQKGLNFPPGTEYRYCNTGYFLASILVERVSKNSLRAFARDRIFAPLGMRHTRFFDDHTEVVPGRATGYAPRQGGGFQVAMSDWEQVGDGGVQTSIEDLTLWAANLGSGTVGGRSMIETMTTPARLSDGAPLDYGLGLTLDSYRGLKVIEHGGAWAGYRAMLMRFPESDLSVLTLCNIGSADTETLSRAVADEALRALGVAAPPAPSPKAPQGAAEDLGRFAGLYVNEHLGETLQILATGGLLQIEDSGQSIALAEVGAARDATTESREGPRFKTVDGEREIAFRKDGTEASVSSWRTGGHPAAFLRARAVGAVSRDGCAGVYDSDELGPAWTVADQDGRLALRWPGGDDEPLVPLLPDLFDSGFGVVRFVRDPAGHVAALAFTDRGVVNLMLRKRGV